MSQKLTSDVLERGTKLKSKHAMEGDKGPKLQPWLSVIVENLR